MRRAASLFLPSWSTDRLRKRDASLLREAPLVTALPDRSRRLIAAVDAAARKAGLAPGMTVTKARSLIPDLIVIDADPEDDLQGLRRLALWAGHRYAPVVAPDPPHGLLLDISGCESLFGGEDRLAKDLFRRVLASGLNVQLAVADTIGCAHAVARHVAGGRPSLIPPGKARAALSLLPVAALRIEPGVAADLARMGFTRIEQLIAAPRAPLAKRFGAGLYRRLDQALGHIPEPIEPIFPKAVPRVRRGLLEPIGTADAFAQVIHDLTADLSAALVTAGQGARRLDLFFHRVDGDVPTIRIGTATATRDPRHLAKLLCQKIDTIDPGLGVEAMTLVAPLVEPLGPAQASGLDSGLATSGRGPDLPALVDALANRFGQRRLYRLTARPSTMPEREVACLPALASSSADPHRMARPLSSEKGTSDKNEDAPPTADRWDPDCPRPARLISPPEKIEVIAALPDHPPALFIWRGTRHRVAAADGPERLYGEWWRAGGQEADTPFTVRDYYQVETASGGRFWLFRLGDGEHMSTGPMTWFIHGAFC
ncbi:DUF6504 family protein [Sphingomonas montanisoli]|uniref:DNA polymerase Y family protein n=1 Tax=Sphingomonas montanisoli TaxID=2606412 RepID=A0A5D9C6V3_9SPHN|nr:DUF6504 family protein [Sphingomonas montanisoli]TZG25751.1 DNA polymerase Y family protein [Sphingomonas montanisoli]